MTKRSVKANELSDVDVNRISLVKRGANRIPFRILKGDDGMSIDLARLFKRDGARPVITAVLLAKSADLETASGVIVASGLSASNREDADHGVTFHQAPRPQAGDLVVKLDDTVAVVIADAPKAFNSLEFRNQVLAKSLTPEGFVPSVAMATAALGEAVRDTIAKGGDADVMVAEITAAAADYQSFVAALVPALPQGVFKLEDAVVKGAMKSKATGKPYTSTTEQDEEEEEKLAKSGKGKDMPADMAKEKAKTMKEGETETAAPASSETETKTAETVAKTEEAPVEGQPADAAAKPTAETAPPAQNGTEMLSLLKSELGEMMKSLQGDLTKVVDAAVGGVKTEVAALAARVEGIDTRVQKAEGLVKSTVVADAAPGDRVAKSEETTSNLPLLDTAFERVR